MTVHVFAGSLVDYYAAARPDTDRSELEARLQQWADSLAEILAPHVAAPPAWKWSAGGESFAIDALDLRAVRLLAAYAQCSEFEWPDDVPDDPQFDPAWLKVGANDYAKCQYPQVVIPEVWLPVDGAFTTRQPLPDGEEAVFGSLPGLVEQLGKLNEVTFGLSAEALLATITAPAPDGRDFLARSQRGLAMLLRGASQAVAVGGALLVRP